MAKRHSFVLVVLILAIVSLAIPESRRVMALQLRYALTAQAYPSTSLMSGGWPDDIPLRPPTTDAAAATAYSKYLALAELDRDHRVQYSYRAIKLLPDRPTAYVSAIMARANQSRYQRAEQTSFSSYPQYEHVTNIDPKSAAKVLRLAQEGRRIDPDNALFDLVAADMLFGLHRDADAIRMIHSAAGKPRYSDYRRESVEAVVEYCRSAGLPEVESRLVGSGSLWSLFLLQHRRVFELGVWKARELEKSGKSDEAEKVLLDLCQVGDLMCKGADYFTVFAQGYRNTLLVGAFVPAATAKGSADGNEAGARKRRIARSSQAFRAHGWPLLASTYERIALPIATDHARMREGFFAEAYFLWPALILLATLASSIALNLAVVCLILSGCIWVCLRAVGARSDVSPNMTRKAQTVFLLLILGPWLAFTSFTFAIGGGHSGNNSFSIGLQRVTMWNYLSIVLFLMLSAIGLFWFRNMSRFRAGKAIMILVMAAWVLALIAVIIVTVSIELPDSWIPYCVLVFILCVHATIISGMKTDSAREKLHVRIARMIRMDLLCLARGLLVLYLVLLLGQLPFRVAVGNMLKEMNHNEVQWLLTNAKQSTPGH